VITGTNLDEGLIFTSGLLKNDTLFEDLRSRWDEVLALFLLGR
jgi:hypothetical protein